MIEVINDKCVGCGACLKACAYDAIRVTDKLASIDLEKCTLCGACVQACPFDAIVIRKKSGETVDKGDYRGVWVFAEQRDGEIAPVVFELLGQGRELAAQMEQELTAVLFGSGIEGLSSELIAYGADQVIEVDDPELKHFRDERYAKALTELALKYKPAVILAGATVTGRSFIPRVAIHLRTGLTADCTGLEYDAESGNLLQTRPAFGGNIMATIVTSNHRPQMATVRHKVMNPLTRDDSRSGVVICEQIVFDFDDETSDWLGFDKELTNLVNITEANIMFMIPIQPTIREILAIAPSTILNISFVLCCCLSSNSGTVISKSFTPECLLSIILLRTSVVCVSCSVSCTCTTILSSWL